MATSHNFDQFSRRIGALAVKVRLGIEKIVRGAALTIDQVLVLATPVDTGRARANWIVTTGTPAETATEPPDPSGGKALSQAIGVVSQYKLDQGAIFITNNVEYIVPLDNGHSQQAPAGMTAQAIAAGRDYISRQKALDIET